MFLWGRCGEGQLQAVQALWAQHSTERGWPRRSLSHFWKTCFEEEIFLHWDVGFLCDRIDCLLQLKSRRQETPVCYNRARQRVSGYMCRKTYISGGTYLNLFHSLAAKGESGCFLQANTHSWHAFCCNLRSSWKKKHLLCRSFPCELKEQLSFTITAITFIQFQSSVPKRSVFSLQWKRNKFTTPTANTLIFSK